MRALLIVLVSLVALAVAQTAGASQVVSTSTATNIKLGVNGRGEAMITYTSGGTLVHVLASGAVNALPPRAGAQQVRFKLAYDGGYARNFGTGASARAAVANLRSLQAQLAKATQAKNNPLRYALAPRIRAAFASVARLRTSATDYWKTFTCPRYDGPPLAWLVVACKAPDGSYWAVQQWQRQLPDYGVQPSATQQAWEVHLAHWRGPLPVLTIATDWAWHQWDHLYGTFTYMGKPVYGFHATPGGLPLDSFGRNLYVDTLDSKYGSGWRRENSFLTHKGTGAFCYSVNPHGAYPSGMGTRYRATIIGPGVTPDVTWEGVAPGPYSKEADAVANQAIAKLHDSLCRPN